MKKVNRETLRKMFEMDFSNAVGTAFEGGANGNAETELVYKLKGLDGVDCTIDKVNYECKYNEGHHFTFERLTEKKVDYLLISCADNKILKGLFEKGYKGLFSAYINRVKIYIVPVDAFKNSRFCYKAGKKKEKNLITEETETRQFYRIAYKVSSNNNDVSPKFRAWLEQFETL